jgi:hypothetical protein
MEDTSHLPAMSSNTYTRLSDDLKLFSERWATLVAPTRSGVKPVLLDVWRRQT